MLLPLALAALASVGCSYTPETTVMVRDPSAVRVEIETGKGLRTILPPAAEQTDAPLPESVPPYHGVLRQKTSLHRLPAGPIEVRCPECSPDVKTLVPMDGRIVLGDSFGLVKFDFAQKEMRIRFRDVREAGYGILSGYDADAVTPWANVVDVRRVSTPDRDFGVKMLLSAAIGAALGGLALGDGIGDHHSAATAFGGVILPLSALLAGGGAWYLLAPARDEVLFKSR